MYKRAPFSPKPRGYIQKMLGETSSSPWALALPPGPGLGAAGLLKADEGVGALDLPARASSHKILATDQKPSTFRDFRSF